MKLQLGRIVYCKCWFLIGNRIIYYETSIRLGRIESVSQLMNRISKVSQKLLKYFNATLSLKLFAPPFPILPDIFVL